MLALGVESNGEDPITSVRGTDGRSGKTVPDDIEPERGQVPKNLAPDSAVVESKDICDILHEDVARSKLANDSPHLSPQNGLGMSEALSLPGGAGPLTWEAPSDDIDGSSIGCSKLSDVGEAGSAKPSFPDAPSPVVLLASPGVLDAGEEESEIEESDV